LPAKITAMSHRVIIKPPGVPFHVVEVFYTSAKGVEGSVVIPKEEFTEEKAKELVKREAAIADKLIGSEV